jgi:hypothetical protein
MLSNTSLLLEEHTYLTHPISEQHLKMSYSIVQQGNRKRRIWVIPASPVHLGLGANISVIGIFYPSFFFAPGVICSGQREHSASVSPWTFNQSRGGWQTRAWGYME